MTMKLYELILSNLFSKRGVPILFLGALLLLLVFYFGSVGWLLVIIGFVLLLMGFVAGAGVKVAVGFFSLGIILMFIGWVIF